MPCSAWKLRLAEHRVALAEADLRQARAAAHDDREGARRDFQIERAGIAGRDLVEFLRPVGDDAGEDVEPAGGAFRIGRCGELRRQVEAFHQRHDIDAAGLQHRAFRKVDDVQLQPVELVGDEMGRAGQEAGAHAECLGAEAQVEARRLDLVGVERRLALQPAGVEQAANGVVRQNARVARRRSHDRPIPSEWPDKTKCGQLTQARRRSNSGFIPW